MPFWPRLRLETWCFLRGFLLGVGWNGVRVAIDRGAPLRAIMSELMTEDAEGTRRRAETPRHFVGPATLDEEVA
jgi:hypothetical protein